MVHSVSRSWASHNCNTLQCVLTVSSSRLLKGQLCIFFPHTINNMKHSNVQSIPTSNQCTHTYGTAWALVITGYDSSIKGDVASSFKVMGGKNDATLWGGGISCLTRSIEVRNNENLNNPFRPMFVQSHFGNSAFRPSATDIFGCYENKTSFAC